MKTMSKMKQYANQWYAQMYGEKNQYASDCGAGKKDNKGFQPGNTCGGDGDGKNTSADQGGGDKPIGGKATITGLSGYEGKEVEILGKSEAEGENWIDVKLADGTEFRLDPEQIKSHTETPTGEGGATERSSEIIKDHANFAAALYGEDFDHEEKVRLRNALQKSAESGSSEEDMIGSVYEETRDMWTEGKANDERHKNIVTSMVKELTDPEFSSYMDLSETQKPAAWELLQAEKDDAIDARAADSHRQIDEWEEGGRISSEQAASMREDADMRAEREKQNTGAGEGGGEYDDIPRGATLVEDDAPATSSGEGLPKEGQEWLDHQYHEDMDMIDDMETEGEISAFEAAGLRNDAKVRMDERDAEQADTGAGEGGGDYVPLQDPNAEHLPGFTQAHVDSGVKELKEYADRRDEGDTFDSAEDVQDYMTSMYGVPGTEEYSPEQAQILFEALPDDYKTEAGSGEGGGRFTDSDFDPESGSEQDDIIDQSTAGLDPHREEERRANIAYYKDMIEKEQYNPDKEEREANLAYYQGELDAIVEKAYPALSDDEQKYEDEAWQKYKDMGLSDEEASEAMYDPDHPANTGELNRGDSEAVKERIADMDAQGDGRYEVGTLSGELYDEFIEDFNDYKEDLPEGVSPRYIHELISDSGRSVFKGHDEYTLANDIVNAMAHYYDPEGGGYNKEDASYIETLLATGGVDSQDARDIAQDIVKTYPAGG